MSDIAPRHAGLLFGLCNTFGSLAGILGVSGGGCGSAGERPQVRRPGPRLAAQPSPACAPHPLPVVCGFVLERTGSFSPVFLATAALYVLGTAVWYAACRADPQF